MCCAVDVERISAATQISHGIHDSQLTASKQQLRHACMLAVLRRIHSIVEKDSLELDN